MRRKSERKEIEMMVICSMLWIMLYILDLENAVMFVYLAFEKYCISCSELRIRVVRYLCEIVRVT
jgi:hypothetical protein